MGLIWVLDIRSFEFAAQDLQRYQICPYVSSWVCAQPTKWNIKLDCKCKTKLFGWTIFNLNLLTYELTIRLQLKLYFWHFPKQIGKKNKVKKTKVLFVYVDKLKVKTSRNVKRSFYKNLVQNTTHTERKLKTGTKGGIHSRLSTHQYQKLTKKYTLHTCADA